MIQATTQQQSAIEKLHRLKVGALFMEPGTGKTRTAYELVRELPVSWVLWLTPFQTKANLAAELQICGGLPNVLIVGIESLQNSDRLYLELMARLAESPAAIVCDESLKIKNWEAKRTKRVIELGKLATYKLVLNGTPITRNLLDIWAQFEFLSPRILNMPMAQFKNTFCEYLKITKRHNGRTTQQEFIVKYHNVDYLYSIIEPYVFECDLQLTIEQQHHVLHFSLSDESREAYNRWKGEFLDAGKMEMLNNNIFLRMTQKMQHAYCCDAGKADALRELLAKHDPEKVIVYCKYVDSYKAVQQAFPMLQVLSYGKHAIGLNLQQYNVTVYWDKTFDYAQMVQSEFRTYRTGQQSDCLYYRLTGDVGLERLIDTNIDRKQTLLDYFKAVGNKIIDEL